MLTTFAPCIKEDIRLKSVATERKYKGVDSVATIKTQPYTQISFNPSNSRINRFWRSYSIFLAEQSNRVKETCEELIQRRQLRSHGDAPFGLYIADWLSEPFWPTLTEDWLDQLTQGYIYLYLYGLFVDDFNDSSILPNRDSMPSAAHAHLLRATLLMSASCCQPLTYLRQFEILQTRFLSGDGEDMDYYHSCKTPEAPAWEYYILKCSLPKAILFVLRDRTENSHACDLLASAYDAAALGFCLIDDVTDWENDFINGRTTYPIAKAFTQRNGSFIDDGILREDVVGLLGKALYRSGAIKDNLVLAIPHLEKSQSLFEKVGAKSWASLTHRTSHNAKHICQILENWPLEDSGDICRIDRLIRESFATS